MSRCLYIILGAALTIHNVYSQDNHINCEQDKPCNIDCHKRTIDGHPFPKNVHCNDHLNIHAYHASDLTLLCNAGQKGCEHLYVDCPKYKRSKNNFCRIDCSGEYGCQDVEMWAVSNLIEVNCMNDDGTCYDMTISNEAKDRDDQHANTFNISCNTTSTNSTTVCYDMYIYNHYGGSINLDCHNRGRCESMHVHSATPDQSNAHVSISAHNDGVLYNSYIHGSPSHDLLLYLDTNGFVENNMFYFNTSKSSVDIQLYGGSHLIKNTFEANYVPKISITSDLKSTFSHNNIDGDNTTNYVNITDAMISNSNINTRNAAAFNLYGSILLNNSYVDVSKGKALNIINSQITSHTMISADNVATSALTNCIIDDSTLNVAFNEHVNMDNISLLHTAYIYATYVVNTININVTRDTILKDSVIDVQYAHNFSLISNGTCDKIAIYAPDTVNSTATASITCIEYGCQSLDLYTHINANDIQYIPLHCPCDQDVTTACIQSWDIYCNYDKSTAKYLNESVFKSAKQCDGVCCGDILHSMHEPECDNNFDYICKPNEDCFIDCNNVNNTNNVNQRSNFSCNSKQSIINATYSESLTVLCHKGIASCNNLTIFCPEQSKNASCNITCDGKNGCNSLTIDTQKTSQFILHCIADSTCSQVSIDNDNNIKSNSVQLNCSNSGCSDISIDQMGKADLTVNCNNGSCDKLSLNCTECNNFIYNCHKMAICSNSLLNASNAANFELICSSINGPSTNGCHNITTYLPSPNKKEKKTKISCDNYGCDELNIYTLDAAITDDITVEVTNCPCNEEIHSLCITEWKLYCNGDKDKPSTLINGECSDDCCGDIVDELHEQSCDPFNCPVSDLVGNECIVNCTDLVNHDYICHDETINTNKATALNVFCKNGADCSNLEVNCPPFNKHQNVECNIYCDGHNNCDNIKINTNGINKFNFDCSGQCNDILINNNFASNSVSISCNNAECDNMNIHHVGQSQVNLICNEQCKFDQLFMNGSEVSELNIYGNNDGVITNSIFNVEHAETVNIAIQQMINSKINGNNMGSFNFTSSIFNNNTIDSSLCITQNIHLSNNIESSQNIINSPNGKNISILTICSGTKDCSFYNNTLNVNNASKFELNAVSIGKEYTINGNVINGNHLQTATLKMRSDNILFTDNTLSTESVQNIRIVNEATFDSNQLNANYANQLDINGGLRNNEININEGGVAVINGEMIGNTINGNNIFNISLSNALNENITNNTINIYNATYSSIYNQYSYTQNKINGNNVTSFNLECGGDYIECGQRDNDWFNLTNAHFVNFAIGTSGDNAFLRGFGGNIMADNTSKIQMNVGSNTKITENCLFLNGYNASNLIIFNNGSIKDMLINATLSKQVIIRNYEHGVINGSNLFVENATNIDIINNGVMDGMTINAENSNNIYFSVDSKGDDDNNFVLNADHALLFNMTINGVLSNNKNINTQNVTSYIVNGYGLMTHSVINCSFCKDIKVNLSNITESTLNGSYATNLIIDGVTSFKNNNLFLNNADNVLIINNGNFSKNTIYGNNIKNTFNLSCFSPSSICGYQDLLFLNHTKYVNIYIGPHVSNKNILNVSAEYAKSINIEIDNGLLRDSIINGKNAKYLSVICNADNSTHNGCNNVSIISSPLITNNKASSYLICKQFGCKELDLYTRTDANDMNITGESCPCSSDLKNLCIKKWQIHCKNDSEGISVFSGYKNCTGKCCGDVSERLAEHYCESTGSSKQKTKDWIYILIACIAFVLIVSISIYIYYKRKNKRDIILLHD